MFNEMLDIAVKNGGLLIKGRAGTGKTYCGLAIASILKQVSKIAFTNKAALNIKGRTIHKFLKIDKDGKMSKDMIKVYKKSIKYIFVDEISMIAKPLWKLLVEFKKATGITFILVGDHRQCPPVEKDEFLDNYFEHSAVKYLVNNNLCELTVMKRYNQELWDLLEDVDQINIQRFGTKICQRNLCYYNRTRKRVNKMMMEKYKTVDAIFIPAIETDEHSQDMYVYKGMPLIAMKNVTIKQKKGEDDLILLANSEFFILDGIKDGKAICLSDRANDDGEKVKYKFEVELENLQKFLYVNYCATVHKSQGSTLSEDYTIWDWNRMSTRIRYTAMSRAKDPSQLNFQNMVHTFEPINNLINNLAGIIAKKIEGHRDYDASRGFNTNIDVAYINDMIEEQGCMCHHCQGYVKLRGYRGGDPEQFSVDRIDDTIGHVKGNVVIACWKCNRSHQNRKM
jgi:ATP-dependent exoDNAse (exonuclease V) alpha subunit